MNIIRLIFPLVFLLVHFPGNANPVKPQQSIFDILQYQEVLKVNLELPLQYLRDHRRDTNDHAVKFSFLSSDGQLQEWNAEVSLRGRFRRMRCDEVPPLKIKFKKKDLRKAGLTEHNDMKLVTYCEDDSDISKTALIKEYLAYKLYNEISPASYRVQLIEITYRDIYTRENKTQFAFLIEDTAQLRDRLAANKADQFRYFKPEIFAEKTRHDVAMFQYLIGNTDWDFKGPRNIKYMEKDGKIIPIPYDFDFSGFVSAPYALLTSQYGQTSLKDRVWLGFDEDKYLLNAAIKPFAELEPKFLQLIDRNNFLNEENRIELRNYVATYFSGKDIRSESQVIGD